MRMFKLLAGVLAASASVPAAAVTVVTFNAGSGALPPGFTVFQNYEAQAPGAPIGTNAFVFANSVANQAARPAYGSTGNFGAVQTGGTYTVNFAPTTRFGFVLGSLDTYNSLTLLYEGGGSQTYAGGQIINDLTFPSGDQISGETNGFVWYNVTSGPRLIGATFTSRGNSFEFDNLATAVPEPATWAVMLGGFIVAGTALRRRKSAQVLA